MRYISLFSGIEAASVAWESLGWEPVAFSEIEPFPCEVLAKRFPHVANLGDITKIDWTPYAGSIDVVVGGSPCQSFSIAGNRTGLDGASGLMWEYVRAVREIMPSYVVWENVPGALSSTKGEDFRCLLEALDGLGYGLAWRVLDAQYFRVAQRRRRVFLVGSLGNLSCAEILFERESLRWDHPSSKRKRQELAAGSDGCAAGGGHTLQLKCGCAGRGKSALIQEDMSATLSTANMQTLFQPIEDCLTPWDTQSRRVYGTDEVSPTLDARESAGGNSQAFLIADVLPFDTTQITSTHNRSNPQWADPCHTLAAASHVPSVICVSDDTANAAVDEEVCGTLKVGGSPPMVAKEGASDYVVRRLTPLECERLQGFPDGWTDIEVAGRPASDTARYKALGNSMAVPVMRWIGERMERFEGGGE